MRQHRHTFLMRVLVLLALLSVVAGAVGCGSDDGASKVDEDVAAMMKKMPRGTDMFAYFDVDALRSDNDLAPVAEAVMEGWDEVFETLGIPLDDIDAAGLAGEETLVFDGSFDLDDIRDALEDGGMDDDEYLDMELWEAGIVGVALVSEDCIIFQTDGDIEDCVDAMQGKRASVYDDEDITETVGRLPAGIMVMYGQEGAELFGEFDFDDLEATASSIGKKDSDTLSVVMVYQFEDEDAADDALEEIEDGLKENAEGVDPDTVEIEQDGRHVKVAADVGMDAFSLSTPGATARLSLS